MLQMQEKAMIKAMTKVDDDLRSLFLEVSLSLSLSLSRKAPEFRRSTIRWFDLGEASTPVCVLTVLFTWKRGPGGVTVRVWYAAVLCGDL